MNARYACKRDLKPKRGKQKGRNQYRIHVYFEDGAAWKCWNDEGNPTLHELRKRLREAADQVDKFIEAESRRG